MSGQEKQDGREQVVYMDKTNRMVKVNKPGSQGGDSRDFTFDAVYDATSKQEEIYNETATLIVDSCMTGYNGTMFAYGQTGTGKTHTMVGADGTEQGIIPRAFDHIFRTIDAGGGVKFLVRVSYLEIYNEEIRDLLSKSPKEKLELKESSDTGTYVKDLSKFVVKSVGEMQQVMEAGQRNRSVASTLMNNESSRSHSIFTITIESCDAEGRIRAGKLNLVDLAGSERQSKTGATGETLKEATKINLSLSALGNVISALVDGKTSFIPYRDSKLTRLLQDSLGGNTRTVMVANCGPADYNYDETCSTLRYANRAKSIKNKPRINEDPKDAMIREFEEEIARLRAMLGGEAGDIPLNPDGTPAEIIHEKEEVEVVREVEKVVEKEVIKYEGRSEAEVTAMEEKMAAETHAMMSRLEAEREEIMRKKEIAEEERKKAINEINKKEEQHARLRAQQAPLLEKLKAMEDKMLQGKNLVNMAMQQEEQLKEAQEILARQREEEDAMKNKLEKQEEDIKDFYLKCNNAEDMVQQLTKKLETLWQKFKMKKQEIDEVVQENQREKLELHDTVRDLTKELRLKVGILGRYIPAKEFHRIKERAQYDEVVDEWHIPKVLLAGNTIRAASGKRPISAAGRRALDGDVDEDVDPNDVPPNMYYTYTDDGPQRAETVPKRRVRSAREKRPGTASRKGRTLRTSDSPESPEPHLDVGGASMGMGMSDDPLSSMRGISSGWNLY